MTKSPRPDRRAKWDRRVRRLLHLAIAPSRISKQFTGVRPVPRKNNVAQAFLLVWILKRQSSKKQLMPDNTFDIVSKIDLAEVNNAIQQAMKEIVQRYDLKNSHSDIQLNEKDSKILIASQDEFKLKAVNDVFE